MSKTEICKEIGISRPFLYSVFSGEKTLAPDKQLIAAKLLKLQGDQRNSFYDLAAKERGEIPIDIVEILADEERRRDIRTQYLDKSDNPIFQKECCIEKRNNKQEKRCSNNLLVPCCYQGGKQRVSKEIVDLIYKNVPSIDDETQYYDVCCGSGAITVELLNRGVNPAKITMLDVSSWGSFWNLIGNGTFEMSIFDSYLNCLPADKSYIKEHMTKLAKENALIDEQYKYILLQACSFGGKQIWRDGPTWKNAFFRSYWEPTSTSIRRSPANPMQPSPATLRKRVANLVNAGKGLTCINSDVFTLLEESIAANSVIYIDPPYRRTTAYAFEFDVDDFVLALKQHTKAPIFVSEGLPLSENAVQLAFGGAKGGISGNKRGKHEEWLSRV